MPGETLGELVWAARRELRCTLNRDYADLLGVSLRTIERYSGDVHVGSFDRLHRVVRALYPINPARAEKIARALGTNLVALGCVPATREQRAAARPNSVAFSDEVMAVVQAAADASRLSLDEARVAVAAAVSTALDLGLTLQQLDPALSTKPPSRR